MTPPPWPRFHFESNLYFGDISSPEDWRKLKEIYKDMPLEGLLNAREATFKGARAKAERDASPNYGFYKEHDGKKRLRDFLLENGIDLENNPELVMEKPEYYFAIIGPADRAELDRRQTGEGYIRSQVKEAFSAVIGHHAKTCSSGWGVTEEEQRHMEFATEREETKKMLIQSYYDEGKKLPRYIRAWELLLEEEAKQNG